MYKNTRTGATFKLFSTPISGTVQIVQPNPRRARIELYITNTQNANFSRDKDGIGFGCIITSGATIPIVLDYETHGNAVQGSIWTFVSPGFSVAVVEVFFTEDAP